MIEKWDLIRFFMDIVLLIWLILMVWQLREMTTACQKYDRSVECIRENMEFSFEVLKNFNISEEKYVCECKERVVITN